MSSAPVLPPLVKSTLGRLFGAALNRLLALDPTLATSMAALDGRRLELRLTAPPLAFAATVREGRFEIGPAREDLHADLSLGSSLGALIAQVLPGSGERADVGRMHISGDAELARRLQQLMRRYNPDVEGLFASVFGDVAGVQLARGFRHGLDAIRDGARAAARDGADFLVEESRDLVGRAELDAFCDDVDDLRDAVERLERRMRRAGLTV